MSIEITSDWHEVDLELDRLALLPDGTAIGILDALLAAGFAATVANVHVITGRLKASGESTSLIEGKEWVGEVHFGDRGFFDVHHHHKGPEVMYAIYEKRRGGMHDFLNPLDAMDSVWAEAMLTILRGGV